MINMNITESLRLAFSSSCFILILAAAVIFFVYSYKINSNVFKAGSILSLNAAFFAFLAILVILSDKMTGFLPKEIYWKMFQTAEIFLLSSIPFFILTFLRPKEKNELLLRILIFTGLFLAVLISFLFFANPEFLSSILSSIGLKIQAKNLSYFINSNTNQKIIYMMFSVDLLISLILSVVILIKEKTSFGYLIILGLISASIGVFYNLQATYTRSYGSFMVIKLESFIPWLTLMMIFFLVAVFKQFFHIRINSGGSSFNYEKIVEVADEMLFSLSPQLDIIAANDRAKKVFQIENNPTNFINILYINDFEEGKDRLFWKERIMRLKKNGDKLSFNTHINNGITSMPAEYHFRFDCYTEGKEVKIIGRAWPIAKSKITKYLDMERLSLTIENNIALAENIAESLSASLREKLNEREVLMLRIGLYEMIVNAIEHGNLGIASDKKARAEESGYLFDFINDRQKVQKYKDKKVFIDYYYDNEKVIFRITDMGLGFDYETTLKKVEKSAYRQEKIGHSGILMALSAFDSVEYNEKGNQVLLKKQF